MIVVARALLLAALALAGGCAVQKTLVPTGGSRADGTIELSYEFGPFESPQVDMGQGALVARQRCAAWGYSDAQPFGGQKSLCQQDDGFGGCNRTLVTIQYQCIGAGPPQPH